MKIKYVTLTGADDSTSIEEMFKLSEKYPFVEWGILFSRSKSGVERYPGEDWVSELVEKRFTAQANLSAHLCGGYVSDAFKGFITFLADEDMEETFDRVQLNCYKERLKKAYHSEKLWDAISRANKPVILGGNYTDEIKEIVDGTFLLHRGIAPLFDASGGHGKLAKNWASPFQAESQETGKPGADIWCGYAGGLGPENVVEEIQKIEQVVGNEGISSDGMFDESTIWIDMESRVRTSGLFDLKKCEAVLKAVATWMG
jgi:phosphoribosylanthranilate isomerase